MNEGAPWRLELEAGCGGTWSPKEAAARSFDVCVLSCVLFCGSSLLKTPTDARLARVLAVAGDAAGDTRAPGAARARRRRALVSQTDVQRLGQSPLVNRIGATLLIITLVSAGAGRAARGAPGRALLRYSQTVRIL